MRVVVVALSLGVLMGLAMAGCGPTKRTCSTSTCPQGCCDASGTCQSGFDQSYCGTSGFLCQSCAAGTTCVLGQCRLESSSGGGSGGSGGGTGGGTAGGTGGGVGGGTAGGSGGGTGGGVGGGTGGGTGGGSASCSPSTCGTGCCSGTLCITSPSAAACGRNGGACAPCSSGSTCASGQCTPCSGCIDALGLCQPGTASGACGQGGTVCAFCTSPQVCQAGGTCAAPSCSASSCPSGCCNGNQCVTRSQMSNAVCGTGSGGAMCTSCVTGQTCDTAQGRCVTGAVDSGIPPFDGGFGVCDAISCPNGCCDLGIQCVAANAACTLETLFGGIPKACNGSTKLCE